ncbi:MAG: hypothetical protein JWR44_2591 [Hymenobacter sp.]|jgi:hypothetical protein|nr:hypothetical protein [Hymenobacter sp.]
MTNTFLRGVSRALSGLLLLGLMAGCDKSEDDTTVLLNSDFEQFESWGQPIPTMLSTEKAHSGRYSYCVKQGDDFAGNYVTSLASCPEPPSMIRLEGWTYLPNIPIGSTIVVLEIHCHGRRPDVWKGISIDQVVRRYQKWERFTKTFRLPDDLLPSDEVKLYVWSPERGPAKYFDDLKLVAWR